MTPHEDLPASYMASCEKFFRELKKKKTGPPEKQTSKQQASIDKQASKV